MPAVSQKQFKLMAAVASSPKVAKAKKIPVAVAVEFVKKTKKVGKLPVRAK